MLQSKNDKRKNISTIDIYKNEAFDIGFNEYFKNRKANRISEILNSTDRNLKFSSITYRQINSWGEQDLLTVEREGREWRRFSVMDALWLKIIQELREFGLPLEKIRIAKDSLSFMSEKCGVVMPLLEFYTAFAIGNKMPVLLLIFKDGVTVPANFTQYKVASQYKGIENHLQLNLNELLQGLFPKVDLLPSHINEMPVSLDEMELLAFLRIGNFEKVEISYKTGKMQTVEGMERLDASTLLSDVIKEHKYQKIEVLMADGQKVSLRRTLKKQINKKG